LAGTQKKKEVVEEEEEEGRLRGYGSLCRLIL